MASPLKLGRRHRDRHLEILHDFDELLAVRRTDVRPPVEDGFEFVPRNFVKVQLHEAIPEGPGQLLSWKKTFDFDMEGTFEEIQKSLST